MLLIKLILREAWYHRSRLALAVTATAAMSAMLVWLVGSIGLVVLQFENEGEKSLGHYHVTMIPQRGDEPPAGAARPMPPMPMTSSAPFVEPKVLDELRSNDLVMQVSPARQVRGAFGKYTMAKYTDAESVLRRQRAGHGTPMGSPTIVGIDADSNARSNWKRATGSIRAAEEMQGVMGTGAAGSLGIWGQEEEPVRVGDYVAVRLGETEYKIKIVGLVDQKAGGRGPPRRRHLAGRQRGLCFHGDRREDPADGRSGQGEGAISVRPPAGRGERRAVQESRGPSTWRPKGSG